jgi:tRNA (cmo5U34)-methyltransferase
MAHLALQNPGWRFTAVEPSAAMLAVCRERAEQEGFVSRCDFHQGYLESLPESEVHDAATCFLVSQFILEPQARSAFFAEIAERLKPGGLLASSDLAADVNSAEYEVLLTAWMNMMAAAEVSPEAMARMRQAYARDVGVLSPQRTAAIISAAGFALPVPFFQAGLIHAWLSRRA